MSNPAKTIRKLAAQAADAERRTLLEQFAAELEAWENRLNNNIQAALGMTELHLSERMDRIEALLVQHLEKVGDIPQTKAVNDASNDARPSDA